ncbi:MAG: hypothetical protein GC191_18870 [Azospirillum sp.]|nr:hypothetical protein [Azospirillum sp.]
MRLTAEQAETIRRCAREAFGPAVVVRLFGSRVDDSLRGGDIDLHREIPVPADWQAALDTFHFALFKAFDERKIDTILHRTGEPLAPIDRIALQTGIVRHSGGCGGSAVTMKRKGGKDQDLILLHFSTLRPLVESLRRARDRLTCLGPLDGARLNALDDDDAAWIDAFIQRFCKLQDLVGKTLFRDILTFDLMDVPVSMLDVVAAMEQRSIIGSEAAWIRLRDPRNAFTRIYPDHASAAAQALMNARDLAPLLIETCERSRQYLIARGLVELRDIAPRNRSDA